MSFCENIDTISKSQQRFIYISSFKLTGFASRLKTNISPFTSSQIDDWKFRKVDFFEEILIFWSFFNSNWNNGMTSWWMLINQSCSHCSLGISKLDEFLSFSQRADHNLLHIWNNNSSYGIIIYCQRLFFIITKHITNLFVVDFEVAKLNQKSSFSRIL